ANAGFEMRAPCLGHGTERRRLEAGGTKWRGAWRLGAASYQEIGEFAQSLRARRERGEFLVGAFEQASRRLMRFLQAAEGGIGGLLLRFVLARGFAERCGGFLDVQDVVHHLEGQPDVFSEAAQSFDVRGHGATGNRPGDYGDA